MTNPRNTRRDEILAALPGTSVQVGEKTGAHRNVINRWLTRLHKEGAIRITSWVRWPGGPLAVYAVGAGVDAVCTIERLPAAVNYANYLKRARASGHWDFVKAKLRARAAAERATYTRDPLLAALFGPRPDPGV
jgi:hypothetical protein